MIELRWTPEAIAALRDMRAALPPAFEKTLVAQAQFEALRLVGSEDPARDLNALREQFEADLRSQGEQNFAIMLSYLFSEAVREELSRLLPSGQA